MISNKIKTRTAQLVAKIQKIKMRKTIFMLIAFIFILIICIKKYFLSSELLTEDKQKCYSSYDRYFSSDPETNTEKEFLLSDVLSDSVKKPTPGKSIFTIVSSCSTTGIIYLNSRQACTIESAAKHNPNTDVFVLFVSPVHFYPLHTTPVIQALLNYPNIHFRNVNMWTFVKNTPLEEWFKKGDIFKSEYMMVHISDMVRLITLYKFGGTYFDLDIIIQQSFENLEPNFVGAQSDSLIANGLMNFEPSGFGHDMANQCLIDFVQHFDGKLWGENGPCVLTRILRETCGTFSIEAMNRKQCVNFEVYNPKVFYAIPYTKFTYFFEEQYLEEALKMTNNSLSIHVWNKNSKDVKLKKSLRVAYCYLANENCPNVYDASGEYF